MRVFVVMVSNEPQTAYAVETDAIEAANLHPTGEAKVRSIELIGLNYSNEKNPFIWPHAVAGSCR